MQEILIELDGSNHAGEVNNNWRFWCRLPGGLPLGQHGYRIGFTDLESWDLQVPAYLQPAPPGTDCLGPGMPEPVVYWCMRHRRASRSHGLSPLAATMDRGTAAYNSHPTEGGNRLMNKRMLRVAARGIDVMLVIGWMAALCCGPLADSAVLGADEPTAQRAADLAPPVLVMAGGKPIDVDGHAAPFVGDFDEDGKNDLLVGQYVYGKLRIYRNVGTHVQPTFDGFEWFTVGGLPACVPAGCNVGFTPHLVDFDGDGRTDILTGSTIGVHFLFRRNNDGTFAQGEVLRDRRGEIQFGYPERHRYNSTVFAHDWDQDGDLDLLLGYYNFSLVPNEGSRGKPVWGDAVPLEINGQRIPGGIVPPCAADWDGDGRDDLVIGRGGDIVWYRNVGEKGRPVLATPEVLVPDNNGSACVR